MSKNESSENKLDSDSVEENKSTVSRYPSAEIMISVLEKEYDIERDRKTRLETRAGVLLTVAFAILTFAITNISISDIVDERNSTTLLVYFVYGFVLISLFIILVTSIVLLIHVLLLDVYKRIDISSFTEELARIDKEYIMLELVDRYREVILSNKENNDKKTSKYKKGTISVLISIGFTAILYAFSTLF